MVRRAFSGDQPSWWGRMVKPDSRPRPTVKAPPRMSTMGSQSTMAPADEAASTAPPVHASTSASQTDESLSTDRRCMGDPPER